MKNKDATQMLLGEVLIYLKGTRREHDECEDGYYSCPKSRNGEFSMWPSGKCSCGADDFNESLDAIIKKVEAAYLMAVPL